MAHRESEANVDSAQPLCSRYGLERRDRPVWWRPEILRPPRRFVNAYLAPAEGQEVSRQGSILGDEPIGEIHFSFAPASGRASARTKVVALSPSLKQQLTSLNHHVRTVTSSPQQMASQFGRAFSQMQWKVPLRNGGLVRSGKIPLMALC